MLCCVSGRNDKPKDKYRAWKVSLVVPSSTQRHACVTIKGINNSGTSPRVCRTYVLTGNTDKNFSAVMHCNRAPVYENITTSCSLAHEFREHPRYCV